MQLSLLKTATLGSFGGDTQGGERTDGLAGAAITRYCSTPVCTAQAPIYTIYTDGACIPQNPGGYATWGWAAYDAAGAEIASDRGCVDHGSSATNNIAEYAAALQAADWCLASGRRNVLLRTDSRLVVEQVAGRWACNAEHLRPLRDELRARLAAIDAKIEWVPRTQNERADELSRLAYAEARARNRATR